jgi:hypothetical protein
MGDNSTYNSISTNTISTAKITASTIHARTSVSTTNVYADYLRGDGSALSNLSYGGLRRLFQGQVMLHLLYLGMRWKMRAA